MQPEYAYNEERGQYHSAAMLRRLGGCGPAGSEAPVLGWSTWTSSCRTSPSSSARPIATPARRWCRGFRLKGGEGRTVAPERLVHRSRVEAVHAVGHLLGLSHCNDFRCAMFLSHTPADSDRKGGRPVPRGRAARGHRRPPLNPLCQRARSSCGACCGLYNRADHGARGRSADRLGARTDGHSGVPRKAEAFRAAAAARIAERGPPPPVFPSVRKCPLLGFLDPERTRVGAWPIRSSPAAPDLRDAGVYDASICESFLCPSHAWLTEEEAEMVESGLRRRPPLRARGHRRPLRARRARGGGAARRGAGGAAPPRDPAVNAALRGLFALKEELEPGSEGLFGAFRPGADGVRLPARHRLRGPGARRLALGRHPGSTWGPIPGRGTTSTGWRAS